MKNILALLLVFCLGYSYAQAPLLFSSRLNVTNVTGSDPYTLTGVVQDNLGLWSAADLNATADSIYHLEGSDLLIYRITSISSALGNNFVIIVDDIMNSGILPSTGNEWAAIEFTVNQQYPTEVGNLSSTFKSTIDNRFKQRLDANMAFGIADYITTDSFVTFSPTTTLASIPIGKTIWRTTTGSKWQKTTASSVVRRTTDNGTLASTILGVSNDSLLTTVWNSNANNRVLLTTGNVSAAYIMNPSLYTIQSLGETFVIGVQAGTSNVAVNWTSLYGIYNGSTFASMPTTIVPAGSQMNFSFRVITSASESIKFQWTDGLGKSTSLIASNGATIDGDTIQFGGTLNADNTLNLHGKTLTFNGESISGSEFLVDNGAIAHIENLKLERINNSTGAVIINVTINPITLTLPPGVNNLVKIVLNNCGTSFTIDPNGSETIGGASTLALANGDAIIIVYNSTTADWMITSSDISTTAITASEGLSKSTNDIRLGHTYMASSPSIFTASRKINAGSFLLSIGRDADSLAFVFDATNRMLGIGRTPTTAAGNHVLQMVSTNSYKLGIRDDADTYYQYEMESSGGGGLFRMRNSSGSQMAIGYSASLGGWRYTSNSLRIFLNESTGGAATTPIWNVQSTYTIAPGSPTTSTRYYWGFNASPTFSANAGGEFREVAFNPTIVNNSTNSQTTVQAWFGASITGTAAEANTAIKIDNSVGEGINQSNTVVENSLMGNTGIGVASASVTQKLHVAGNARITGAIYDSNNSAGTNGEVLTSTATGTDWTTLVSCSQNVTQSSHGLTLGTPVYWTGTAYATIVGNFASVTSPSGIVTAVIDVNTFTLGTCGATATDLGLADGLYYATNTGLSTTPSDPEMPMFKAEGNRGTIDPMLSFAGTTDPVFTITTPNGANSIDYGETFVLAADSILFMFKDTLIIGDAATTAITPNAKFYSITVNTSANAEPITLPAPIATYRNIHVEVKQIESASNAVTISSVGGGSDFYDTHTTSTSSVVAAGGGSKTYKCVLTTSPSTFKWVVQ